MSLYIDNPLDTKPPDYKPLNTNLLNTNPLQHNKSYNNLECNKNKDIIHNTRIQIEQPYIPIYQPTIPISQQSIPSFHSSIPICQPSIPIHIPILSALELFELKHSKLSSDINNKAKITNITKYIVNIIKLNSAKYLYEPNIKRYTLILYNYLTLEHSYLDVETVKPHIKYFLELDTQQRIDILQNFANLSSSSINNISNKPKIFKILESTLSDFHKKIVLCKLQNLETMQPSDSEYYKLLQWIDNILDIPFNIYKQPIYITESTVQSHTQSQSQSQSPSIIFSNARQYLDTVIYGQHTTKQHILEIIAKMISNPQTQGSVFAVEGEPGTGKTTLIKNGLSHVLGLPFIFISLGGAQDSSYLSGENYSYVGSKCGKIIQALKEAKCLNPIFYFDELDKVSNTERGQEIINLLIHITDYSQNQHFLDYYMDGITIDLSRATFIFSFNDRQKVCPILLDRMNIIKFNPYTIDEKKHIIEFYLLPLIATQYFNNKYTITFYNDIHKNIILNNIINTNTNTNTNILDKIQWTLTNNTHIILNNTSITDTEAHNTITDTEEHNTITDTHKIHMYKNKKISKKKHNHIYKSILKYRNTINKCNNNGGVRYIIRKIETIISKINIDILEATHI